MSFCQFAIEIPFIFQFAQAPRQRALKPDLRPVFAVPCHGPAQSAASDYVGLMLAQHFQTFVAAIAAITANQNADVMITHQSVQLAGAYSDGSFRFRYFNAAFTPAMWARSGSGIMGISVLQNLHFISILSLPGTRRPPAVFGITRIPSSIGANRSTDSNSVIPNMLKSCHPPIPCRHPSVEPWLLGGCSLATVRL